MFFLAFVDCKMLEKKKQKNHAKENIKKKFEREEGEEKKKHAKGRSNCDSYSLYKICQCLLKIILEVLNAALLVADFPREHCSDCALKSAHKRASLLYSNLVSPSDSASSSFTCSK